MKDPFKGYMAGVGMNQVEKARINAARMAVFSSGKRRNRPVTLAKVGKCKSENLPKT